MLPNGGVLPAVPDISVSRGPKGCDQSCGFVFANKVVCWRAVPNIVKDPQPTGDGFGYGLGGSCDKEQATALLLPCAQEFDQGLMDGPWMLWWGPERF